jgi:hypothetical protein
VQTARLAKKSIGNREVLSNGSLVKMPALNSFMSMPLLDTGSTSLQSSKMNKEMCFRVMKIRQNFSGKLTSKDWVLLNIRIYILIWTLCFQELRILTFWKRLSLKKKLILLSKLCHLIDLLGLMALMVTLSRGAGL